MTGLRTIGWILCVAFAAAGSAHADCAGANLIAALPVSERAALDRVTERQPFAEGNLWRATKAGETVVMIGTYHLGDPRFDAVLTRLEPFVDAARTLMLEAGPQEEQALLQHLALHPDAFTGPSLEGDLSPEDWSRLGDALKARGMPLALGAHFKPWYLSAMLAMPACLSVQAAAEGGLDKRIAAYATTKGLDVTALEPWDTALHVFDDFDRADQIDMVRQALDMQPQAEDMMATMTAAYFAEDSRRLWEFQRRFALAQPGADADAVAREFDLTERTLMAERNRAWIPRIEAAAARGPVFAAFGALHLSGETGVLALLEADGWALERLPLSRP